MPRPSAATVQSLWAWILALGLALAAVPALAGTARLGIGFDSDNNPATGCTIPTANGAVAGIEVVATTVIGTTTTGATVSRLERQVCSGGVLGAPAVYDNGGWSAGLGNGSGGRAAVETSVPLAFFPAGATLRSVVTASDGAAGQDATAVFTVALAPAVGLANEIAVPVSPWLLPPLVAAMLALTWWLRRRYPGQGALVVMIVIFAASGLAWAATVLRDGNIGDWAGVLPVVTDPSGDGAPNADIVAVYQQQDGGNLYFRIDADIRTDSPGNVAPTVSAGVSQTITLPAGATLSGTAADDGLPNPPGALTLTWSKVSGPGNVAFANAALASTTATFSAAGTYGLRLSAFDGALTTTADVTITVNAGGGGGGSNLPPIVNAGPNQAITLPATATLTGSATDDGLPSPPGALTTNWSLVSGPLSGVVFGDPGRPATTATFAAPGVYVLQLSASDGALAAISTVEITVADGPPTLTPIADRTINLGERLQVVLEGRDGNGNDVLTYALTTAPGGATLNPAPLVDWVPTAAQLGTHAFTARVTDSSGNAATASFNVTVVHVNTPPQLAPQASLTMKVGAAFARILGATDPDAGDTLTYALVSGPSGMSLSGTALSWSTSGRNPGDYVVTVKVTDSAGAFDQKTFTLTLQQSASPLAVDDNYVARLGTTLTVPPTGVLGNDLNPGGKSLTAVKKSDPLLGSLTAFGADGAFTYVPPATNPPPAFGVSELWRNDASGQFVNSFPVIGDVNGDGFPDLVLTSQFIGDRAIDGRTGATIWTLDATGYTDCRFDFPTTNTPVLADVDDDGKLEYVGSLAGCERDSRVNAAGYAAHDRIFALDTTTGRVKWASPRVSASLGDVLAPGSPPSTEDRFKHVLDATYFVNPSVTRLSAGALPTILFRRTIQRGEGYYTPLSGPNRSAGCRALTGLAADDGLACRATILMSGVDGTVQQILTAPNPTNMSQNLSDPWRDQAPFTLDIDGDGVLEIISGSDVWKKVGGAWTLLWQSHYEPIQTLASDLDGDGRPEIIHFYAMDKTGGPGTTTDPFYQFNGLVIYDGITGVEKRRIRLPFYWTAWLTIADADGDGAPDFVINTQGRVMVVASDGRIKWTYDIPPGAIGLPAEARSGSANVQVYDLDGDGIPEVVTNSHSGVVVLNGRTGAVKYRYPSSGFHGGYTAGHHVQIVDADNDGHADILAVNVSGPDRLSYILLRGAPNNWLPGPKAHHQVNFMQGDISGNGHVEFNTAVPTSFRNPKQLGVVANPRATEGTTFTYAIHDGESESAPATVFIAIKPTNRPPVITSTPPTGLFQRFNPTPPGGLFVNFYQVTAIDPDAGDTLTYSMPVAPPWHTMDATGRIRFEPTCGSYGQPCPWGWTYITVRVTDSQGAYAEQSFMVNLTTMLASVPNVVGMMLPTANAAISAAALTPQVLAEVADRSPAGTVLAQDPIPGAPNIGTGAAVGLTVSKGPQPVVMPFVIGQQVAAANLLLGGSGLRANVTAVFSTTIPTGEVMAQSPAFGTLLQPATAPPVELTVSAGGPLSAPIASIVLEPGPGPVLRLAGDELQYRAIAMLSDGTSADVTLSVAWASTQTGVAAMGVTGIARSIAVGTTTISATLSGKTGQGTLNVAARVLGDNTPPTVAIASPADGAAVTGPMPVIGTASDANFLRYELALATAGSEDWRIIGEGTTAVTNGALGTIDPATLLNDLYTLRLTAFDKSQNSAVVMSTVQVSGDRKVGLFTLTYQDLNLPATGIPLTVHRTYDSRDKSLGDFGIGWRIQLQTLRLRTNRVLGTGWVRVVAGATVTLLPTSGHWVSIALPDGRVEEFDMIVSPTSNIGSLSFTRVTGYQPRAGTLGKLQALANNSVLIVSGGAEDELVDDYTLDTYSPKLYRYTGLDGTQMEISPTAGVTKVTDPNGNAVTFGPGGILHSDGRGIVFTRDTKGRIVAITDLLGHSQTYAYDGNGDLVGHTDPMGGTSRFSYNRMHGLVDIRNALGTRVTRNDYDAGGRLVAMTDAAGRQITFAHNTGAGEDLVTDRLGRQTRLVYDATGNITRREAAVTIDGVLMSSVTTSSYDALGNETSTVDPDGRRTTATFQGILPLSSIVDPAGLNLSTAFAYNPRNDVTNVTDAGGRSFTFSYDANGNLLGAQIPGSGPVIAVNNARGEVTETRDAANTRTVQVRDAAGRVTREEIFDAASNLLRRKENTWDANGNQTSETLHRTIGGALVPLTTSFTYDAANRVIAVTDPAGSTARMEYDANGQMTAQIDSLGRRTTYSYDTLGRRIRTTHPDGTTDAMNLDAEGNVVAETDRAGRTTTHDYDELGRRVQTTKPDGTTTRTIYTPGGRIAATIDARGARTDMAYDAAGRLTTTTLPAVADGPGGPVVRPAVVTAYNALGAPVTRTDPKGRVTAFEYDANGRLLKTTHPDATTMVQTWDALGRRASVTNEEGQVSTFGYDGLGRLVTVAGLAGNATYTYDEAGNVLTSTDALGRITMQSYDRLNRLLERRYPGGETEKFAYDAVGNMIARVDGLGRSTVVAFDVLNRPSRKTLPGGTNVDYAYGADGQRSSITDARGITTFGYDTIGRLATVRNPGGETVSYTYDANGNLASISAPGGALAYAYDALNRLTQTTAPEGQTVAHYDIAGNRVRTSASNGVVTDALFDVRNRPSAVTQKTGGGVTLQSYGITYAPSNRITTITEADGSSEAFGYDGRGRLATELRTGTNPYSISHAYDAVGNRLQTTRNGTPSTFSYDINDRLISDGSAVYAWGAGGTLASRTQGGVVTQYGYDAEQRLVSILGGGLADQYVYDDDGNRVLTNTATGTTRMLVAGANPTGLPQVLEDRDAGNNLTARYSYGNELLGMQAGGAARTYLRDALGSTRLLTDATGTITDRYQFDAYGSAVSAAGSTPNPYRYRSERLDAGSGLYQMRARYYNPATAGFLSRDPLAGRLESPMSLHRYAYANDDPVGFFDPTGRESLASLTVAQSISNTIKLAENASKTNQACNAFSTLGAVGYVVLASELAYGFATAAFGGWGSFNTSFSVIGFNPAPLKGTDIKAADIRIDSKGKLKFAFSMKDGSGQSASFNPFDPLAGFEIGKSGPIKVGKYTLKKELKKCETIPVGAVQLKQSSSDWMGIPLPTFIPALSIEVELLKVIRNEWKLFDGISLDIRSPTGF